LRASAPVGSNPTPAVIRTCGLSCGMDSREERLARNEAIFRDLNENIEHAASRPAEGHLFTFVCECSNLDCTLLLPLTLQQYEEARADPRQFIVAPGHGLPEIETVVSREARYEVVTKQGEAAALATRRDPRRRNE
jgi:hypothetical protein